MVNTIEDPQLEASPLVSIKQSNILALAALFGFLIVSGFTPIMLRWSQIEVGPSAAIFDRLWIAIIVLVLWNSLGIGYRKLIKPQQYEWACGQQSYKPKIIFLLFGTGLFFSGTMLLWSWSLTQTSVTNSTLIHNFSPLFTTAAGWLFLQQRFDRSFLSGCAIAVVGIIILCWNDLQLDLNKIQGDLLSLLSCVCYAGYFLSAERLRSQITTQTILEWCCKFGILLTLPIALINHEQLFPVSFQGWISIGTLGIATALANFLLIYSFKQLSASFVALVLLLDPILTSILAWGIFGETLSWLNVLAFSVILLGLFLAVSSPSTARNFKE